MKPQGARVVMDMSKTEQRIIVMPGRAGRPAGNLASRGSENKLMTSPLSQCQCYVRFSPLSGIGNLTQGVSFR
jgi:hypothetical protein